MAAEDAVPDRLGLAVEAAEALVRAIGQEPGGRVAVVAFAGRGVLRCPLTENLGAVVDSLHALRPGEVQPGGSDLRSALAAALDAFRPGEQPEPDDGRSIVLISDGEDHTESDWKTILPDLIQARVIVHSIAVGDREGAHPIPLNSPSTSAQDRAYLTYRGETVQTRRDDEPLRAIAEATEGAFLPLGLAPPSELRRLYRDRIAPVARRTRDATRAPERPERFTLFVVAAFVIGLISSCPGLPRRLTTALLAVSLLTGAGANSTADRTTGDPQRAAKAVRRGDARYAVGDLRDALAEFERAAVLDPDAVVPRYNRAATLFQLNRFEEAAAAYREARTRADAGLRTKIDFALGNTAVALGDFAAAIAQYDACLASPARGPVYDAVRRDASINRSFAQRYRDAATNSEAGSPLVEDDNPRGERPAPSLPGEPEADFPSENPQARENRESTTQQSEPSPTPTGSTRPASSPPNESPDRSPQERLEDALRNARRSRDIRRTDEPPPPISEPDRKIW